MKNLRSKNPKEFWNILNRGNSKRQPDIPFDILYNFYKDLNSADSNINETVIHDIEPEILNSINHDINVPITKEEIFSCMKRLKNNKACGEDKIVNEYMKSTCDTFLPIYEKLFNLIFDTGQIPSSWLIGNIKPIYKNKGDKQNPKNFRPITILSCIGKLFTAILNERIKSFVEEFAILEENQCGFRPEYSTSENLYTLMTFFDILKSKKKKMFVAFVDFEKAFDTVWREGLWYKLLTQYINGKMYNTILNLYNGIKSNIVYNGNTSDYFSCNTGVRQGENLSPMLFALYLNDLESFLNKQNLVGLKTISDEIEVKLNLYLKLFILLYADDTAILADSADDLQKQLNSFQEYCKLWKLQKPKL